MGVAPLHTLVVPPSKMPPSKMPPSKTPPSTVVEVAPLAPHPTHWLATQKALFSVVHEALSAHSTQRPEISHTGVVPVQALVPPELAQDTQVFCAEQNGRPAALLQ